MDTINILEEVMFTSTKTHIGYSDAYAEVGGVVLDVAFIHNNISDVCTTHSDVSVDNIISYVNLLFSQGYEYLEDYVERDLHLRDVSGDSGRMLVDVVGEVYSIYYHILNYVSDNELPGVFVCDSFEEDMFMLEDKICYVDRLSRHGSGECVMFLLHMNSCAKVSDKHGRIVL